MYLEWIKIPSGEMTHLLKVLGTATQYMWGVVRMAAASLAAVVQQKGRSIDSQSTPFTTESAPFVPFAAQRGSKSIAAEHKTIQYGRKYSLCVDGFSFGNLTRDSLTALFRNGSALALLLERQLAVWFPLVHVGGNADHDFVDRRGTRYDAKMFTKWGCNFVPSAMKTRKFDQEGFDRRTRTTQYILCDNRDFPNIDVIFVKGTALRAQFDDGKIPPSVDPFLAFQGRKATVGPVKQKKGVAA